MTVSRFTSATILFSSSCIWTASLGMTLMLVPLYARALGMSGVAIGSLVAIPGLVQLAMNFVGGALTDRHGGKSATYISYLLTMVAGAAFALTANFWAMFAAQLLLNVGRGIFWPSNWALTSRLPGDQARNMGRLNALSSAGQLVGTGAVGVIVAFGGLSAGFWTTVALAVLSAFVLIPLPAENAAPGKPQAVAGYIALLKRRDVLLCVLCSYIGNLPNALGASFYPILAADAGYGPDIIGWVMATRNVGSMAAGMLLARFVGKSNEQATPLVAALMICVPVALSGLFGSAWLLGVFQLIIGTGAGMITIYTLVVLSNASTATTRGAAMAMPGMGWAIGFFLTPMAMGALQDGLGLRTGFVVFGSVLVVIALFMPVLQGWAFVPSQHPNPFSDEAVEGNPPEA